METSNADITRSPEWAALTDEDKRLLRRMIEEDEQTEATDERPLRVKTFAEMAQELEVYPALTAVLRRFNRFAEETSETMDNQLSILVTRIANAFLASAAWLFIKRHDGFHAVSAHKTRLREKFLRFDEPSIVTHVADTGVPFAAPDVNKIVFYKRSLRSTNSTITVPLKTLEGEIIGIFHLESTEEGKYRDEHLPGFVAASTEIISPLLTLRALDRVDARWFPWRSFNGLSQLEDICHDLRRVVEGIQCTIWAVDSEYRYLFVHTTTGFAEEYIDKQQLPFQSFNGELLTLPPGAIGTVRPGQGTRIEIPTPTGIETREGHPASFESRLKDRISLKWRMSLGTPLYIQIPGTDKPKALGTLSLSCFDDESEATLPTREELTKIATEIGDFITGYLALREELATTHLDMELRTCLDSDNAFKVIEKGFTKVFDLKTVDIDGYLEGDENRIYITKKRKGVELLTRLGGERNPFRTIRANVMDDHGKRLGIIHLTRLRPFTPSEKVLAEHLANRCAPVFTQWRSEMEAVAAAAKREVNALPLGLDVGGIFTPSGTALETLQS